MSEQSRKRSRDESEDELSETPKAEEIDDVHPPKKQRPSVTLKEQEMQKAKEVGELIADEIALEFEKYSDEDISKDDQKDTTDSKDADADTDAKDTSETTETKESSVHTEDGRADIGELKENTVATETTEPESISNDKELVVPDSKEPLEQNGKESEPKGDDLEPSIDDKKDRTELEPKENHKSDESIEESSKIIAEPKAEPKAEEKSEEKAVEKAEEKAEEKSEEKAEEKADEKANEKDDAKEKTELKAEATEEKSEEKAEAKEPSKVFGSGINFTKPSGNVFGSGFKFSAPTGNVFGSTPFSTLSGSGSIFKASTEPKENPWAEKKDNEDEGEGDSGDGEGEGDGDSGDEEKATDSTFGLTEEQLAKRKELLSSSIVIPTGEESEESVFTAKAKLYALSLSESEAGWKERGTGPIHINKAVLPDETVKTRIVMRTDGVFRVILNLPIISTTEVFAGLPSSGSSNKFTRVSGYENGKVMQYAIKCGSPELAKTLYDTIKNLIPK